MSALTTEELRSKADELGIKYTSKTSDDTLLAKVEKAEKEKQNQEQAKEFRESIQNKRLKRRVKIVPLNPNELNLDAKYFMLMNSSSVEKAVIKFNTPWFVSDQMIEHIKSIQYLYVPSNIKKPSDLGATSKDEVEKRLKPAYTVVELGPITKEEFDNMKKDKMLRDSANGE